MTQIHQQELSDFNVGDIITLDEFLFDPVTKLFNGGEDTWYMGWTPFKVNLNDNPGAEATLAQLMPNGDIVIRHQIQPTFKGGLHEELPDTLYADRTVFPKFDAYLDQHYSDAPDTPFMSWLFRVQGRMGEWPVVNNSLDLGD